MKILDKKKKNLEEEVDSLCRHLGSIARKADILV